MTKSNAGNSGSEKAKKDEKTKNKDEKSGKEDAGAHSSKNSNESKGIAYHDPQFVVYKDPEVIGDPKAVPYKDPQPVAYKDPEVIGDPKAVPYKDPQPVAYKDPEVIGDPKAVPYKDPNAVAYKDPEVIRDPKAVPYKDPQPVAYKDPEVIRDPRAVPYRDPQFVAYKDPEVIGDPKAVPYRDPQAVAYKDPEVIRDPRAAQYRDPQADASKDPNPVSRKENEFLLIDNPGMRVVKQSVDGGDEEEAGVKKSPFPSLFEIFLFLLILVYPIAIVFVIMHQMSLFKSNKDKYLGICPFLKPGNYDEHVAHYLDKIKKISFGEMRGLLILIALCIPIRIILYFTEKCLSGENVVGFAHLLALSISAYFIVTNVIFILKPINSSDYRILLIASLVFLLTAFFFLTKLIRHRQNRQIIRIYIVYTLACFADIGAALLRSSEGVATVLGGRNREEYLNATKDPHVHALDRRAMDLLRKHSCDSFTVTYFSNGDTKSNGLSSMSSLFVKMMNLNIESECYRRNSGCFPAVVAHEAGHLIGRHNIKENLTMLVIYLSIAVVFTVIILIFHRKSSLTSNFLKAFMVYILWREIIKCYRFSSAYSSEFRADKNMVEWGLGRDGCEMYRTDFYNNSGNVSFNYFLHEGHRIIMTHPSFLHRVKRLSKPLVK